MEDDTIIIQPVWNTAHFWIVALSFAFGSFGIVIPPEYLTQIAQICLQATPLVGMVVAYYLHRKHMVGVAKTANAAISAANTNTDNAIATIATLKRKTS